MKKRHNLQLRSQWYYQPRNLPIHLFDTKLTWALPYAKFNLEVAYFANFPDNSLVPPKHKNRLKGNNTRNIKPTISKQEKLPYKTKITDIYFKVYLSF